MSFFASITTVVKLTFIVFSSLLKPIQGLSIESPAIYLSVAEDNFSDEEIDFTTFNYKQETNVNNQKTIQTQVIQNSQKGVVFTDKKGQATSFFLNEQLATNPYSPGFSTYFVMNTYRTEFASADGYVFVIAANSNALGASGGGLGYSGIDNSVGIEFDFFVNGNENMASTDVFENGMISNTLGTVFDSNYSKVYTDASIGSLVRAFHTWIEYNAVSSTLEIRVALSDNEDATINRPGRPTNALLTRTIALPQISSFFYAGFTAATGGSAQGMSLKSWYIANQFIAGGIQPNVQNIVVDNVVPTAPTINTSHVQDQYQMTISGGTDNGIQGIAAYQYRLPNGGWQPYDTEVAMTTAGTYQARSVDYAGNFSSPSEATLSWIIFVVNGVELDRVLRLANPDVPYPIHQTFQLIGYDVDTWYSNPNLDEDPVKEIIVDNSSVTLYGKRVPLSYSLSYFLNGGVNEDNPSTYTIETSTFTLNAPSREGYTFVGWYDNASLLGNPITSIPLGSVDDISLYAKWEINTYQLQFQSSLTTTTIDAYFINYQANPTFPIAPMVSGYTFLGWAYEGQPVDANWTMPARDVTLEAMYNGNQSMIVFITDQGIATLTVQTGSPIGALPTLALPNGYEFIGWSTSPDQADLIDASFIVPHNELITLYPIWIIVNETINNMDLRQGASELPSWQQPLMVFFSFILVMTFLTTYGLFLRAKQHDHESK